MDIDTPYPVHLCLSEFEFDLHALFPVPPNCAELHLPYDTAIPSTSFKKRPGQETTPRLSKRKHMKSQQQQQRSQPPPTPIPQGITVVNNIENDLHHLQDEWASIEIVLNSLRNAFSVHPLENAPEQLLDEVDRELSIAYDDLKAQVRHLARGLQRLDSEIEPFRPHMTSLTRSATESKQPEPRPCGFPSSTSAFPRQQN